MKAHRNWKVTMSLVVTLTILTNLYASAETVKVGGASMYADKSIIANAYRSKDHITLVSAVKAAGLIDTLSGAGPFTFFAPTNDAFSKLPKGRFARLILPDNKYQLAAVLTYHVVPGRLTSSDLIKLVTDGGGSAKLKTVEGDFLTLTLKGEAIDIADLRGDVAKVTIPNVMQSNGVVHVIDRVMLPDPASYHSGPVAEIPPSFFPWPPPEPSATYDYPNIIFLGKGHPSVAIVAERIKDFLDRHQYSDRLYFLQTSGKGFVILTKLERIDDAGLPAAGNARWDPDVRVTSLFSSSYLQSLAGTLSGHFRVIAFVITKDLRPPRPPPMSEDLLREWRKSGLPALPAEYQNVPFTTAYRVYALIYEFPKPEGGSMSFVDQSASRISSAEHMAGAGLTADGLK